MAFDGKIPELFRPNVLTLGYEHEWSLYIFDVISLYFDYDNVNNDDLPEEPDQNVTKKVAVDILRCIPAWKLFWNDDEHALDEVCRQLQLQICVVGRVLLFIAKQIPHHAREHALLANLHVLIFTLSPSDYMAERFLSSPRIRDWARYWLSNPLTNKKSLHPDTLSQASLLYTDPASAVVDHLPSRNIWLFDHYLTPFEHANLMALSARVYQITRDDLLQLDAQTIIEQALCHNHPGPVLDALVPGVAAWFLYAYAANRTPEEMLRGWYDVCLSMGNRLGPTGPAYLEYESTEARWWAFLRNSFAAVSTRTDVGMVAREYAAAAYKRMDWLIEKRTGFWAGLAMRVGGGTKKRETRL